MLDISIVNKTSLKRLTGTDGQAGRQTDRQDHVLSQADTLTKNVWSEKKFCVVVVVILGFSVQLKT